MNEGIERRLKELLKGMTEVELERYFCFSAFYVWRLNGEIKSVDVTPWQFVRSAFYFYEFQVKTALGIW